MSTFDVFLSHNSADKAAVELIAHRLRKEAGLNPFLDKWHLILIVFSWIRNPFDSIILRDLTQFAKIISFISGDYLKSLGDCRRTRGLHLL